MAPVEKHIQEKMVDLFMQCDAEYGRRVAEGLEKASMSNDEALRGPIGATHGEEAVKQAEAVGHEAKEY